MMMQIEDTLLLEGNSYALIGCSGELVHPRQFRMAPLPLHAACTRGWHCAFEIDGPHLLLRALALRCAEGGYRPIDGIAPRIDPATRNAHYEGLALRVGYSGRLRVGMAHGDARSRRIGRPARGYRAVLDIDFEAGQIERIIDRTDTFHAPAVASGGVRALAT